MALASIASANDVNQCKSDRGQADQAKNAAMGANTASGVDAGGLMSGTSGAKSGGQLTGAGTGGMSSAMSGPAQSCMQQAQKCKNTCQQAQQTHQQRAQMYQASNPSLAQQEMQKAQESRNEGLTCQKTFFNCTQIKQQADANQKQSEGAKKTADSAKEGEQQGGGAPSGGMPPPPQSTPKEEEPEVAEAPKSDETKCLESGGIAFVAGKCRYSGDDTLNGVNGSSASAFYNPELTNQGDGLRTVTTEQRSESIIMPGEQNEEEQEVEEEDTTVASLNEDLSVVPVLPSARSSAGASGRAAAAVKSQKKKKPTVQKDLGGLTPEEQIAKALLDPKLVENPFVVVEQKSGEIQNLIAKNNYCKAFSQIRSLASSGNVHVQQAAVELQKQLDSKLDAKNQPTGEFGISLLCNN